MSLPPTPGLPSTYLNDPKIKDLSALPPANWQFVSTHDSSFRSGKVGEYIRYRYWEPSPYEVS